MKAVRKVYPYDVVWRILWQKNFFLVQIKKMKLSIFSFLAQLSLFLSVTHTHRVCERETERLSPSLSFSLERKDIRHIVKRRPRASMSLSLSENIGLEKNGEWHGMNGFEIESFFEPKVSLSLNHWWFCPFTLLTSQANRWQPFFVPKLLSCISRKHELSCTFKRDLLKDASSTRAEPLHLVVFEPMTSLLISIPRLY